MAKKPHIYGFMGHALLETVTDMTSVYYSEIEPEVLSSRRENNTLPEKHTHCLDPEGTSSAKSKNLESVLGISELILLSLCTLAIVFLKLSVKFDTG